MRLKSILFLVILLSCSSGQVLAACNGGPNWLGNDAVGNDPDFSVRAHELGSLVTPSPDLAVPIKTSTSKPRIAPDEKGSMQPSSSGPNMSMPDPSPKPLAKQEPNNNSNQTLNQTGNQSSVLAQQEAKPIDLSGKWSVKFSDSTSRSLDLILLSTGADKTMGSGTLVEDGTRIPVTASGTITGQDVTLTSKTVVGPYVNKVDREYDLDLVMTNNTLSGAYVLKSGGKFLGKGNATAVKQ
jgi:hypothetical protein